MNVYIRSEAIYKLYNTRIQAIYGKTFPLQLVNS